MPQRRCIDVQLYSGNRGGTSLALTLRGLTPGLKPPRPFYFLRFTATVHLDDDWYTCPGRRGQQVVDGIPELLCTHASTRPAQSERSQSRAITDIHEAPTYAKGITRLRHFRRTTPPPAQRGRHNMHRRSTSPMNFSCHKRTK